MGPRWLENHEYLTRRMWEMDKARGYTSPDFKEVFIMDSANRFFEPKVACARSIVITQSLTSRAVISDFALH